MDSKNKILAPIRFLHSFRESLNLPAVTRGLYATPDAIVREIHKAFTPESELR